MAKMFYSADEASKLLGVSPDELTQMARQGKIREFRDAGKVNYKVDEVDKLAAAKGPAPTSSDTGELVLEPAEEDSGLELMLNSGSDVMSIADSVKDKEKTSAGTRAGARGGGKKDKEGTVVPSVGVSVFDDDALDEMVDPLAQTHVSEGPVGFEGIGSGSGILDLTRESDDTSLGAELLDEIVPAEEATLDMGDATRAGLEDAVSEETADDEQVIAPVGPRRAGGAAPARATTRVEYGPDAASNAMGAVMAACVLVMLVAGLAVVGMVRGVEPAPLRFLYDNMMYFVGGSALVVALSGVATYFLGRRA